MANIRKLAKDNGCSLPWIARNEFGRTRQWLYGKIDADNFSMDERLRLVKALRLPFNVVFPHIQVPEAVAS